MRDLLAEHGVGLRLDDPRFLGESLKGHFHGPLTEVKEQAAKWVAEATAIRRQGARDAAGVSGTGCTWTPPPPTHTTRD